MQFGVINHEHIGEAFRYLATNELSYDLGSQMTPCMGHRIRYRCLLCCREGLRVTVGDLSRGESFSADVKVAAIGAPDL